METIDSVVVAAFVGGFLGYLANVIWKFTDDNQDAISVGAGIGAGVQIVVRLTGIS